MKFKILMFDDQALNIECYQEMLKDKFQIIGYTDAKSIEERAKVTGVPKRFLKEVYNRGSAAWLSGHRPGQSTHSWAYPRISSFLLCGKTYHTADADLAREAKASSASARRWWNKTCKTVKW